MARVNEVDIEREPAVAPITKVSAFSTLDGNKLSFVNNPRLKRGSDPHVTVVSEYGIGGTVYSWAFSREVLRELAQALLEMVGE